MNSLQKEAMRLTDEVDISLEEIEERGSGIVEAAEDGDFYYIVTRATIPKDSPYGHCFWVIDKKTRKAIRAGIYIGWITAIGDLEDAKAVKILKEPFSF